MTADCGRCLLSQHVTLGGIRVSRELALPRVLEASGLRSPSLSLGHDLLKLSEEPQAPRIFVRPDADFLRIKVL